MKNARNQVRNYFYDSLGRVTGYSSPEDTVSYTYDANGNVLTVTDSHGTITRTYDALNRITSYTDTYGKTIGYEYDSVGNLTKITYPDNTAVTYAYDANKNLTSVTDWANRVTTYTYDANNRVIGVVKPDGSTTTNVYDSKQRITSSVERKADNTIISGFSYVYDTLGRISEETHLDKNEKMCYTYDELNRVTVRTIKNATTDETVSTETFTYDAAGNITGGSVDTTFVYDTNNRLVTYNGNAVSYDLDGNMLDNGSLTCTFDSSNKILSAGGNTYTYNAEDVRIKNVHDSVEEQYTYNTNCKLSKLLMRTVGTTVTKYVYGHGLISEETSNAIKVYHFDYRGSTVAVTDSTGAITDTFEYYTSGKIITRTGTSDIIFCYNGRDGVVTDSNNLIYMRARYYSPELRRFVNADIISGTISEAITLNRYAYANGNPVSNIDPFGLSVDERDTNQQSNGDYVEYGTDEFWLAMATFISEGSDFKGDFEDLLTYIKALDLENANVRFVKAGDFYYIYGNSKTLARYGITKNRIHVNKLGKYNGIAKLTHANTIWKSGIKEAFDAPGLILDTVGAVSEAYVEASQYSDSEDKIIVGGYVFATEMASSVASTVASVGATAAITKTFATFGTFIAPGIGTVIGLGAGLLVGYICDEIFDYYREKYINPIVENN